MAYAITFAVLVISGSIIFFLVMPHVIFRIYTRPMRLRNSILPGEFGLRYREISFESQGVSHAAWVIYPPEYDETSPLPTVIAQHGFAANRSDIVDRSAQIAKAGFPVFTFDWRAHGNSGGDVCSGGVLEKEDLLNALAFVRTLPEVDENKVALYGFSMGAYISILAAALDTNVRCIVVDSPYKNNMEIMDHVLGRMLIPMGFLKGQMRRKFEKKFDGAMYAKGADALVADIAPRPILFLASTHDRLVPFEHPQYLFDSAKEPKEIFVNEGGGHFDNADATIMSTIIIPFLKKHLAGER